MAINLEDFTSKTINSLALQKEISECFLHDICSPAPDGQNENCWGIRGILGDLEKDSKLQRCKEEKYLTFEWIE